MCAEGYTADKILKLELFSVVMNPRRIILQLCSSLKKFGFF